MKIYLDPHIKEIELFHYLEVLLTEFMKSSSGYPVLESITSPLQVDPVKDYITYHLKEYGRELDPNLIEYITNCLYKSKGAPDVINTLGTTLGISLTYKYTDFHELEIDFDSIAISNLLLYEQKLTQALYHLIFYDILLIKIKELQLILSPKLTNVISTSINHFIDIDINTSTVIEF